MIGTGKLVTILHRSAECYQPGGNWHYIGDMNVPRYGAGSAIGPDGRWYIFGGMTTFSELIGASRDKLRFTILLRNTWTVLDPSFNLGNAQTMPPRFWPRGAVVGNNLWVVGGSMFNDGEQALPVIEQLALPSQTTYLPVMNGNSMR